MARHHAPNPFRPRLVRGFVRSGACMPIEERIARWYDHAERTGKKIRKILIHPSDAPDAPAQYKGLPVVPMRH